MGRFSSPQIADALEEQASALLRCYSEDEDYESGCMVYWVDEAGVDKVRAELKRPAELVRKL